MSLSPGTRFGPYEIVDEIGAGGMGVVYRAKDTKLDRHVAIKVLPESMASDGERIARFEREAKTLASLNHPNIAQIYGVEESGGTTALVLELVEGPTLADRIGQGPLPVDDALRIAMQMAEGLAAAHGQGIVHRDLKPANVKLRPDGTVKVLDFGIAKALSPETITSEPAASPMLTTPATVAGVILGTAAYMSPEQARGKPVDQRADVWAFGCVLYEMLTGQPAFGAEDVPLTLARVLDRDVDTDSLPVTIAPVMRQAIRLCLQKDAGKRIADIRDVQLVLDGAFNTEGDRAAGSGTPARPTWSRALPASAAALVLGAAVAGFAVWLRMQPEPPAVNRFDYDIPAGQAFRNTGRPVMSLSPDGRQFVYNTTDGLYLRTMSDLEARLITGTESASASPSFSPDGQSVAYFDGNTGQLKRIAISGGAPVVIAEVASNVFGVSWEADGTILFGQSNGIYRVSANGGTPELVIEVANAYGPRLLRDGDIVLYNRLSAAGGWDASQIVAESLLTGERTMLIEGGADVRYVSTGHLVYALGDGLYAVAFDPDELAVTGGAVPLVQGIMRASSGQTGVANYDVSRNGTLVYVTGSIATAENTLVWVDRSGREEPLAVPIRAYTYPRLAPDGSRLALDVRDQDLDIWTWDLARETLTRLTFAPEEDEFPVWSPDGRRIAFSRGTGGNTDLFWQAADGTGTAELLAEGDGQIFPASFLPDATGVLVRTAGGEGAGLSDDIAVFRLDGEDRATPLLNTAYEELNPEVSPDGRWLAYTSNESGSFEIYVRPFPNLNEGRWQVSTGGGVQPLWARDGRELFYRNGDEVIAVPVDTATGFSAGNPEVLFRGAYLVPGGGRSYDVAADGERFLMIRPIDSASNLQIVIVENWFEELKRLAPTN